MKTRLVAAVLVLGAAALPAQAEELKLMTGPQGGVWVPLGGALKNMWEKAIPGLTIQALPGAGISNVRAVQQGKADIGFGNSITTVDAIAGNKPFNEPHKNVCNVATLYPQYFQLVVLANAGIDSIKDLKGKSLTTQVKGNTGELITQHILKVAGLSYGDMKVSYGSYTDSVSQMQDGHAQAFTLGTAVPSGAVMNLAASRDIKLLDLSQFLPAMQKINPGYTLVTVKAGTYPKQDKDVKVIGYATHIVASCKLADDKVFAMTKAMADHIKDMAAINKGMAALTPAVMAENIGVPLHPGARKFYQQAGALKN
ncbi:MAG: TAXI family TRAP transporter solute-binding subunit [Rhodospirillaceae bacterium]|nr:TAXI family TRAP transporter solute-binding subunit [Rhodospirillaceae bacterium]